MMSCLPDVLPVPFHTPSLRRMVEGVAGGDDYIDWTLWVRLYKTTIIILSARGAVGQ
ncbi:MAG: hypothetical protein KAH03_08545 [Cocleimonas sp.]|nr:hypothetical protein [Cocleimonas sp.]